VCVIWYLCIGAEGGSRGTCALLGIRMRAFIGSQLYITTRSMVIVIVIVTVYTAGSHVEISEYFGELCF
jgi:hypothetical protein